MAQSVWTKAPVEIVKDLISAGNASFAAVKDSFDLGAPSTNTGNKNTKVTVTPNSPDYTGTVDITYNRLTMAAYITAKTADAPVDWTGTEVTEASTDTELLAVANSVLGLNVLASEFADISVTKGAESGGNTVWSINLGAAETSLLFTGTAMFEISQPTAATPTSDVITQTELDGLDAPTA